MDDGHGASSPPAEGVGLANTRARLERLYGSRYRLQAKPIHRERFDRALARARREVGQGGLDARIVALIEERRGGPTRLAVKSGGRIEDGTRLRLSRS